MSKVKWVSACCKKQLYTKEEKNYCTKCNERCIAQKKEAEECEECYIKNSRKGDWIPFGGDGLYHPYRDTQEEGIKILECSWCKVKVTK